MQKAILIVDDEPITLQGLKKTLEISIKGDKKIITAANAIEAMKIIKEQPIHLLITDIAMPEMSGLELLNILKERNNFPVAIIISAYSDFNYAKEAIEIGVVNYLLKPVKKQQLVEEVEKALKLEEKRQRVNMLEKVIDEGIVTLKVDEQVEGPIKKAIDYVDNKLEHPLSLKEVARHVHLNPSYFSVLFKEQTNMTFSEYITRCRIQKAKSLLLNSNYSVAEVSEMVGYNTSKYFIKIFKEYEGITPSKYKKTN